MEFGTHMEKGDMVYITIADAADKRDIIEKYKMAQYDEGKYGMWVKTEDVDLKVLKVNYDI